MRRKKFLIKIMKTTYKREKRKTFVSMSKELIKISIY